MKKYFLLFVTIIVTNISVLAGGSSYPVCPAPSSIPAGCSSADPFCTGSTYTFPNSTGLGNAGALECLSTTPNPTWYYLQIATSGTIQINIQQFNTGGTGIDVDFALLGPYTSVAAACANPATGCVEDCSYDPTYNETATITGAIAGEYYLLLLTNFSNQAGTITFSQTGGAGATDCSILAPVCTISSVSATPSSCNGSNQYNVTGQVAFSNAPATGTLTVTSSCGGSQVFNAPFTSPINYSINSLTANGSSCTVTAAFSADGACTGNTNYTAPSIPTINAGLDQSICTGGAATLSGSGASTYSWDNGVTNGVAFTPGSTQIYTVTGTNAAGCTNTDQAIVTVNSLPTVNAGTDQTVCAGAAVTLNGSGASTYSWNNGVTNGVSFTPASTLTYTVTGTDGNGCTNTDQAIVTVNALPIVGAGIDQAVCVGASVTLSGSGASTYTWNNGVTNGASFTPGSTLTYTVSGTDGNGCINTDQVVVTVNTLPNVGAGSDQAICAGTSATLSGSGASTYTWDNGVSNGVSFTPASTLTYTVTGTDGNGCINTDQAVVTVNNNPSVDAGTYSPVCADVPTVTLAGTPVGGTFTGTGVSGLSFNTSSGTQTVTYNYTDGNGCAGSDVATITVNPMPAVDAGNNQTFCSGATTQLQGTGTGSATWSPTTGLSDPTIFNPTATISSTTAYTLTVVDNGCTSIDLVTITITNPPALTITPDQSICVGDCSALTVSGADFYAWEPSPDITDPSLANQNVCPATTTTYTVHGYAIGGSAMNNGDFSAGNIGFTSDYTLNTSLQNESTYFVDVNANLHHPSFANVVDHTNGTGNYMIVNGAGTPNSSVWCQTVDVQPNQDYVFSTWVTSVAAGSPAILQFSINSSPLGSTFTAPTIVGQWDEFYQTWNSGVNTSATICIVNQNTTLGGNDFGLDDIFFSAICETVETVTVTVNEYPDATIQAQAPLCQDAGTVTLSAAETGGTWSGPGVNSSTGVFNPATAGAGTHDIVYTISGQCPSDDTLQVVVNGLPTADAGTDQAICAGDQVTLSGNGAANLSWTGGVTDNTPFTPSSTQTYTLTVTDANGCDDTDDLTVVVNSLPTVSAGADQTICEGTVVTLSGTGAATYSWDNGVNNNISFIPGVGAITYTITGTDANGCEDTDQVTVSVLPLPIADITTTDDTIGYAPLSVNFDNNSSNATIFAWDFGNGQTASSTTTSSQSSSYGAIGTYYVVLSAGNSVCEDIDTMTVIVIPYPDPFIHIPNVFTPNDDNANDVFFFESNNLSQLQVSIFNRWGEQMYEWDTITGGWDGMVKNQEAEDGTYFYKYTAKGLNGEELEGHGHLTLVR